MGVFLRKVGCRNTVETSFLCLELKGRSWDLGGITFLGSILDPRSWVFFRGFWGQEDRIWSQFGPLTSLTKVWFWVASWEHFNHNWSTENAEVTLLGLVTQRATSPNFLVKVEGCHVASYEIFLPNFEKWQKWLLEFWGWMYAHWCDFCDIWGENSWSFCLGRLKTVQQEEWL